jgi:hypothetical protein
MTRLTLFALVVFVFAGCSKEPDLHDQWEDVIAVEATLIVGQEVQNIKLRHLESDEYSYSPDPVSDANVQILVGDTTQTLSYDHESESYSKEGFIVQPSTTYKLFIEHHGREFRATTQTPPALQMKSSSDGYVTVNPSLPDTVLMKFWWNQIPASRYVVHIQQLEEDAEPIPFENDHPSFNSLHIEPMSENGISVKTSELEFYGWHYLEVVAVNEKYTDIYSYSSQVDQNILEQGPINIENVYGFFTGVSPASFKFYVMD